MVECSAGERYSVVVNANKGGGSFWVGVRTVGLCGHMRAHQVAVLKYRGGPDQPSSQRPNHEESAANRVGVVSVLHIHNIGIAMV